MKKLFKRNINKEENGYILIPEDAFNDLLKKKIFDLENKAEKIGEDLKEKYSKSFEKKKKENLRIWVCKDIDGEETLDLSIDQIFDREYRSQIAIDYEVINDDDDGFFKETILLWYYYGGYKKGNGTLYNSSFAKLKEEIEEVLKEHLE